MLIHQINDKLFRVLCHRKRNDESKCINTSYDHLVGVVWQSLKHDPNSESRVAEYDFLRGALDHVNTP